MIDAIAGESQFLDHLAPVWSMLPDRGRLIVDLPIAPRAVAKGLDHEAIDFSAVKYRSEPPKARVEDGPIAFVVSIGDIKIGRRLGYRRFVFMEHGAGQAYIGERGSMARHPSYAGGMDREDVELFLVPNEYSANLWRTAYPNASVSIVGCPKLDSLPQRDGGGPPVVAISFHWRGWVSPEAGSAKGLFMPVMAGLAKRFHLIGHAHPGKGWGDTMAREYQRAGIEFVPDFEDVCRRADLYVVDNSSTLFEFAATGRPVVVLNAREYRKTVSHGLRFWDAANVGIQVDDPALLGDAIAEALTDPPAVAAARENALSIVYAYRSGGAARAVGVITDWLTGRGQVAA